jgi:hypothetical protein
MALTAHRRHVTLNTDGRPHPLQNTLAVTTLVLGLISLVMTPWAGLHVPGAWFGLVGGGTGAASQMLSATTAERWVTVFGLGLCGIGFVLNLANGGLV